MNNRDIAATFDEVADLLEFQNANPFRVRAYRTASQKVKDYSEPLAKVVADKNRDLTDIEGIGKDLAAKIAELVTTGKLTMLDELRSLVPAGVLALMRIPGMGPKKAATLHKELGINSLEMLRAACEADEVSKLKGFGKKTQDKILAGIDFAAKAEDRMYWAEADEIVQALYAHMRSCKEVKQMEVAGSYRRGRDTIGDLDLLVESKRPDVVMDHLTKFEELGSIIGRGDTKMSIRLARGLQIDLRVVPAKSFGAALQYFTGSKGHNVILRGMARDLGLKINEYGVFRLGEDASDEDEGEYVAGKTEAEVYQVLDLPCFPPELREARQEFEWAATGKLPKLIELSDLQGDLHMHTTASDGKATLREMVEAAQARGLKYVAITDHSPRVSMANGLDAKRLRAQWKEIDRLNRELDDFVVLKGIECDILEKGGMDLPDDVLAEADWVVASVHYGQNQPSEQITARMLGAIENPYVSIIAHPTGRLINRREPYAVDLEEVLAAASRQGKFMELNSNPARLDLDDVHCAAAKRHGIPIVISSDAHSMIGIDVLRYGVIQARRAGLTAADVANTRPWAKVKAMLGKK